MQSTNTLIIDEISMISSKVLGQVQFILSENQEFVSFIWKFASNFSR